MNPAEAVAEPRAIDALDLITFLRISNFHIGTGEALRAASLLEMLAARGQRPSSAEEATLWLAPLLCTTARQQTLLAERISAYMTRTLPAPSAESYVGPAVIVRGPAKIPSVRRWRRWVIAIAVVLGAVFAVGIVLLFTGSEGGAVVAGTPSALLNTELAQLPGLLMTAVIPILWWQWFARRARARHARLERRPFEGRPGHGVVAAHSARVAFNDPAMSRGFQGLRTYRRLPSRRIDVRASVRASVDDCGRPRLVFGSRPTQPAYPILVEAASARDHVVDLARALSWRLREESVDHALYFFTADPRWVRGEDGAPATLADLVGRYRQDVLVLVGDGEPLRDPATGGVREQLALETWNTVVLLTPVPRARWSWRERRLAEAGVIVLPATREGLDALGDFLRAQGKAPAPALERSPAPPGLLTEAAQGGLQLHRDEPPEPAAREALLDRLAIDLTPGAFETLCVLAVYPELRPDLTRFAAARLAGADRRPLADLAALGSVSVLPWFRAGRMPDWLRLDLAGELRPQRAEEARELFAAWLAEGGGEEVEITRDTLAREVSAAALAPNSVLRDALFLRFCKGDSLHDLDVEAPERVIEEIAPEARRRSLLARVTALVMVPAALVAALLVRDQADQARLGDSAVAVMVAAWAGAMLSIAILFHRAARGESRIGARVSLLAIAIAMAGSLALNVQLGPQDTLFVPLMAAPVLAMALLSLTEGVKSFPLKLPSWAPGSVATVTLLLACVISTLPAWLSAAVALLLMVVGVSALTSPATESQRIRATWLTAVGTGAGVGGLLIAVILASLIVPFSDGSRMLELLVWLLFPTAMLGGTLAEALLLGRDLRLLALGLMAWLVLGLLTGLLAEWGGEPAFVSLMLLLPLLVVPIEWQDPGSVRRFSTWRLAISGTVIGTSISWATGVLLEQSFAVSVAASAFLVVLPVYRLQLGGRVAALAVLADRRTMRGRIAWWLRRAFSFRGRARRREIIVFVVIYFITPFLLVAMINASVPLDAAGTEDFWFVAFMIAFYSWLLVGTVAVVAAAVRRLHDFDRRGWWVLSVLPFLLLTVFLPSPYNLGVVAVLMAGIGFLLLKRGDPEPNRFGPIPGPDKLEAAQPADVRIGSRSAAA